MKKAEKIKALRELMADSLQAIADPAYPALAKGEAKNIYRAAGQQLEKLQNSRGGTVAARFLSGHFD